MKRLNPVYGVEFLFSHHNAAGLAVMGTVFLSTTGAEALYSDMGHVGRGNIYFTWPFIKIALVFCYFGQGAWMLNHWDDTAYNHMHGLNPFFEMMTPSVRYVAVLLSVCAGVIASQALITGAYTMVSEATRLNWMPHPAGALSGSYPRPAVHSGGQRRAVRLHPAGFGDVPRFGAYFRRVRPGIDRHDDHHDDSAGRLHLARWQARRRGRVHSGVPGHPVPVLLRFDGEVPARWLVHHAADIGDSADYVHVERRHEAGTRATPAYAARRLRAGSEAAS